MRKVVIAVALLALAAFAAPAQAAIEFSDVEARPLNTTKAGEGARFKIHIGFGGTEKVKDLTQQLPRGFGTNPAQPLCERDAFFNDACPEPTMVGTTVVTATVMPLGFPAMEERIEGSIYFLKELPGELPRLGIVLRPTAPGAEKQFQEAELTINPVRGSPESTIRNFPTEATVAGVPVEIRIDAIDIELRPTFAVNPLVCGKATTRFLANSYADPKVSSAEASYVVTGCPKLPRSCRGARVTIDGTRGADTLRGTRRRDVISGLGGRDVIRGLGGNDVICGGRGADRIFGGRGADLLIGNAGNDRLVGGRGADRVRGGLGRDVERP